MVPAISGDIMMSFDRSNRHTRFWTKWLTLCLLVGIGLSVSACKRYDYAVSASVAAYTFAVGAMREINEEKARAAVPRHTTANTFCFNEQFNLLYSSDSGSCGSSQQISEAEFIKRRGF